MNFVRLEGVGFGRPNADNELPIDIPYQKLSAWLVSTPALPPAARSTQTLKRSWCWESHFPLPALLQPAAWSFTVL